MIHYSTITTRTLVAAGAPGSHRNASRSRRVARRRAPLVRKRNVALVLVAAACAQGGSHGSGIDTTAPTITITAPTGSGPIAGSTVVNAAVADDMSVAAVQFQIDGVDLGPLLTRPPWRVSWDTATAADGSHTLTAIAWDGARNQGATSPLVVDVENGATTPALAISTLLGAQGDETIRDTFVDSVGFVYVTGGTASPGFPTTAGAYDRTFNGVHDVFVAKFTPDGTSLVFSTFLGGPSYDRAYALEVDDQGYVYVAGRAGAGFPTTPGAVQTSFGGDVVPNPQYGPQDGFVAKLRPDGSALAWCTYFGTDDAGIVRDVDVDSADNVYVTGSATRAHYAVTPGAFDTTLSGTSDGLVAEIAADGTRVVWGSYFGGSGTDGGTPSIRVADDGTTCVLGHSQSNDFPTTPGAYQRTRGGGVDLVVLKIAPGGSTLRWASFFGGSGSEYSETHGLWIEPTGDVTIVATTESPDLPFVPASIPAPFQFSYGGSGGTGTGAQTNYSGDGFVAKLSSSGTALVAFTYVGGAAGEGAEGVAVDGLGRVHLSGATYSTNFPVTADAIQRSKAAGADAFLVRFSSDLSTLEFSTFFGGSDEDYGRALAIGLDGREVGAGMSASTDFPTTPGAYQRTHGGGASDGTLFEISP